MGRKGFAGGIVKDLSGKHPVSALMEVCSKRRWGQPEFTLLTDPGPGNHKSFLYKVSIFRYKLIQHSLAMMILVTF